MLRRYEMLLPCHADDPRVDRTAIDLEDHFGVAVSMSQVTRWTRGHTKTASFIRLFVDVADTTSNRQFFEHLKIDLQLRFDQPNIWLASFLPHEITPV